MTAIVKGVAAGTPLLQCSMYAVKIAGFRMLTPTHPISERNDE
jgi:hypothetical protein